MKKTLHALNKMPVLDKIFYILLTIIILCIVPLLHMGFYSHPVGDDYTYGMNAHFAWEQTGSLIEVLKAAITTSKNFWHSYQGPFASAFFMALQPAVISERLYAATPFIMLFMLIFSTSAFLYVLLVKYLHTEPIYCKITTCVLLLFCIELLEAPSEAFFWYCGAVHYIFMHSCMLLLITVLLLAFQNSKLKTFYLFASLPLAICCGGANFVTALTTMILFCCAVCTLLLLRKKRELFILMPSFLLNIISFIINIAAPGNTVREADQLAGLPPVQAIYYAFQYCLNYIGKWTNIYILLGILFLIPIIWKAAASSQVTLRLPGLFTLFSFCLLSSMFAPSTYALGLVVIYGRSLNIIMQTYYLLLILNLYYWFRWLHQCLDAETAEKISLPFQKHKASLLISISFFLLFAVLCTDKTQLTTKSAVHDIHKGYAQAYHQETLHRIALLSMEGVDEVWVPNFTVKPYLLDLEDISTDPSNWRNRAMAKWYEKETLHLSIIY